MRIFVMAVNHTAFEEYRRRLDPRDVVSLPDAERAQVEYLHDGYQLYGTRGAHVVLTSSAYQHPNFADLIQQCRIREAIVHDVRNGVRRVPMREVARLRGITR